ncbi:MAG: 50S ribosomal protein L17 [Dehalococcoidia bacterium]|nr:50S ribosomal protein L17 [Dehalococcoidia bacterium]HRC61772.1 50S ribosomal protein L17 [Dehalococcoidia bacterium]
MKHGVSGRRFDMPTDQRIAMFRSLVTQVLKHDSIQTTEARAKEVKPLVDKMVTLGKRGTLHARRQALAYVYEPDVVERLFEEIAPRYTTRPGGYTRVMKIGPRKGDGAMMAQLELV